MSTPSAEVMQLIAKQHQRKARAYLAAYAERNSDEDGLAFQYECSSLSDSANAFLEGVAVGSLARSAAPVLTWVARLREDGAINEDTAVAVPGGGTAFMVLAGQAAGVALIAADGVRYLTMVGPGEDGHLQVAAGRWLPPSAPEAMTAAEALEGASGDASGIQMVRAAAALVGSATAEEDLSLNSMLTGFAEYSRFGMSAGIASATLRWFGQDDQPVQRGMASGSIALGAGHHWEHYAKAMRDLVLAVPAAPGHDQIRVVTHGAGSIVAEEALLADGGFSGETCAAAARELARAAAKLRLGQEAADYVALAQGLLDHDIRWGQQWLAYADTDRWTFAVAGPDGSLGRYHRNVDLIAEVDSHVSVICRDADGQPTRLEIHIAHRPAETVLDYGWEASAKGVAIALANDAHLYADPEADPPRLTRSELAERIASGQPLPPPAAGIDFITGELLPGTVEDRAQVLQNFFYGVSEDSYALSALQGKQEKTMGWEVRTKFSELESETEDDPDEEDEPGSALIKP